MRGDGGTSVRATSSRKLRVLTLIDTIAVPGGAEIFATRVATQLDRDRFEPSFCATRASGGPLAEALAEAGVPLLALGRRSALSLGAWRSLVQLLRRERIDILHTHKFGSNLWGGLIGRASRVPVVIAHEHSWADEAGTVRRLLDRQVIARSVDAIVAVSREDVRRMVEVERIDPALVQLVPNGVPAWPESSDTSLRQELGIPADAPVAGFVGRLSPVKALDVLIEAVGRIAPATPGLRVLLVGSGSEEQTLREQVLALGLGDVVVFLGTRNDVGRMFDAIDVSVICSDSEGMPLSVLEAMAAGKPVVATRVGGLPELVEDGVTGLLVPPRDPAALAAALATLFEDQALRARLGAEGRNHHRRDFDLSMSVRRIELLYEELFSRSRRARDEGWTPSASGSGEL